jgi:hypothetical protein
LEYVIQLIDSFFAPKNQNTIAIMKKELLQVTLCMLEDSSGHAVIMVLS